MKSWELQCSAGSKNASQTFKSKKIAPLRRMKTVFVEEIHKLVLETVNEQRLALLKHR